MKTVSIGQSVVRSKGDYVVGRIGEVLAIDETKRRAQVKWDLCPKTWVAFEAIEDSTIPHKFTEYSYNSKTGKTTYPKYIKL